MKRLWEVDHPYYCNEGNYFAKPGEVHTHFRNWAEFYSDNADSDMDLNLIFRWDWREGEDNELPSYNGDDYYRNGTLLIFWMSQRKGIYRYSTVDVCRADEPLIRNFLEKRWEYMKLLWEGISQ